MPPDAPRDGLWQLRDIIAAWKRFRSDPAIVVALEALGEGDAEFAADVLSAALEHEIHSQGLEQ